MKKVIIVICILSILCLTNINAQGKAVESEVSVTNTAEVGGDTKEAKTIRVEEQAPGVITEYKEDGTKVVTINLSEVDEDKLPEKYEAEVILEAPVYQITSGNRELYYKNELLGKFERNSTFKLNKRNITESGTFLKGGVDNYPDGLDVKIDDSGNIFILDLYNGRIQKFNSKGKHIKNIPLKDYFEFGGKEGGWPVVVKDEIEVSEKKIYVRDRAKNCIEVLDESGAVLETIEIPETIDGKSTREMRMWADEEGVGVGEKRIENEKWKMKNERRKGKELEKKVWRAGIKNYSVKEKKWEIDNVIKLNFKSSGAISIIKEIFKEHEYIYIGRTEDAIYKISKTGELKAKIKDWMYWFANEWKDKCGNEARPLVGSIEESEIFRSNGNIYLLQQICCEESEKCAGKIRIIKLAKK